MSNTPLPTTEAGPSLADFKAGFLVFLIALPLCLGISMASGFPPVAGVLTAIVGGVMVSFLGSARLTIKGPAAGLIVIAIGCVTELGGGVDGYHRALAVGVVAAGIQIVFALLRTATVGIAMSPSVVHGMLAAIGVIIISKQAHTVLGVKPEAKEPLELLAEIPHSLAHANPQIVILGVASLLILFAWPQLKPKWSAKIPAPLVVLAFAVPTSIWLDLPHAHDYDWGNGHFHAGPEFLVTLPGSLLEFVAFPDFSMIFTATSIKYIVMFALVGTIESTLSVIAVDSIDPEKRLSDLNQDLLATGIGNLVAASIGGLPMISEIVRSKANIDSGARSSWANFSHGLLLLLFAAMAPGVLHMIPLAALGAMLVYTGTRLASPKEFHHAYHIGPDQLLLFTTTLVVTLATDLLIGVGVGIALKVALHFVRGAGPGRLFRTRIEQHRSGDQLRLIVHGAAAFTALLPLRKILNNLDSQVKAVQLDLGECVVVDHTFLIRVHGMAEELQHATLAIVGTDDMTSASSHPHSSRRRRIS